MPPLASTPRGLGASADDGVRRIKKKPLWGFFPSNRSTTSSGRRFLDRPERSGDPTRRKIGTCDGMLSMPSPRRGNPRGLGASAEDGVRRIKKKPLWGFFPSNRPTRHLCRGELEPWVQVPFGIIKRSDLNGLTLLFIMRKMGLEPTRHCCHKILSLARLPVPTLPHLSSFQTTRDTISKQ